MVTTRIKLSTPPETSIFDDGLKRSVVIGNSWAFKIDSKGCDTSQSSDEKAVREYHTASVFASSTPKL